MYKVQVSTYGFVSIFLWIAEKPPSIQRSKGLLLSQFVPSQSQFSTWGEVVHKTFADKRTFKECLCSYKQIDLPD